MCEFLSINVRTDGAISHVTSNSHSAAVQSAGWIENTDGKHVYDSFEWDGRGEFDLARICHDGAEPDRLTEAQIISVKRIYGALQKVMAGNITEIMPGGVLHGVEWWDVYIAALNCNAISCQDKDKIRKELMTSTSGDHGTSTSGYGGTSTSGYGGTSTSGNHGTSTSGDHGTSTSGYGGTSTSGNHGTSTSGNHGTSTSGDDGTSTSGYGGTSTSGNHGTSTSGDHGTSTSGDDGTSTSGYGGTSTSGYHGTSTSGDHGTSTSGNHGTSTSGDGGTSTSGDHGTSTSGDHGTSTSGNGGTIIIEYYDDSKKAWRKKIGEVTVNGKICAGVAYKLNDKHQFVKA